MHLNKYIFQSQELQKYLAYEAHFSFSVHWKFNADSKNAKKMQPKNYGFLDNFILTGNGKFSLFFFFRTLEI